MVSKYSVTVTAVDFIVFSWEMVPHCTSPSPLHLCSCDEPMTDRLGPMGRDNTYGEREGGGTLSSARLQRGDGSAVWEPVRSFKNELKSCNSRRTGGWLASLSEKTASESTVNGDSHGRFKCVALSTLFPLLPSCLLPWGICRWLSPRQHWAWS